MKKIRELLKEKRWRWTAGGTACLLIAALVFAMTTELGAQADEITLGNELVNFDIVTENNTTIYLVKDTNQLQKLGNATDEQTAGKTFRMENDITTSASSVAAGAFAGIFDGNGHVITYRDIDITAAGDGAQTSGLLFGKVSGTVKNLIMDIQDEDASYTRKSMNEAVETTGAPVYEASQNPIIGVDETVSGLDADPAKAEEIYALTTDSTDENYKIHTLKESGTQTTTYAEGNPATDYFGLVCGENSGTIQQVYLTGNAVEITREELTGSEYSSSVQSGYREETYRYLQEIDTLIGNPLSESFSLSGTVYQGTKPYTGTFQDGAGNSVEGLIFTIEAPNAAAKSEETQAMEYRITVENTSNTSYENVTIESSAAGRWGNQQGGRPQSSYHMGAIAANETQTIAFSYSASEDVSLSFTVTGTATIAESTTTTVTSAISNVATVFYETGEASANATLDNGLSAVLELADQGFIAQAGKQFEYILTLENTNTEPSGVVISRNMTISTDLTGWTVDAANTTATGFVIGSNQVIPAGKTVVLTKAVEAVLSEGASSETYTESLTMEAVLTSEAYKYTGTAAAESEFISEGTPVTSGSPVVSGNHLYVGSIAGYSTGTVSQVKQSVDLSGTEISGEFAIGGIAGSAENVSSAWADLYMLGTVNGNSKYYGTGTGSPMTSAAAEQTSALGSNWTTYTKYINTQDGDASTRTSGELAWLVKAEDDSDIYFSYTEPSNGVITAKLDETKQLTDKALTYSIAYNARKSMQDTSEDMVYVSASDSLELGSSGYYRLLNSYATDGYYHYSTPAAALENAVWVYPYQEDTLVNPYMITGQKVVRSSTNPLEDKVQITIGSATAGIAYYNVNALKEIPNTAEESDTEQAELDGSGSAELPFDGEKVQYCIVPVIDGYIYPMVMTNEFSQKDKEPIPKPVVTAYNYYDTAGNKKAYIDFGAAFYEAGSDMMFAPGEDEENDESYSFRYLYSTTEPVDGAWDEENRYIGNDASLMTAASDYTGSAVIPENLAGSDKVYLYVEVSKKNYTSQIYYYGSFAVTSAAKLSASAPSQDGVTVVDGDIVTITGAPENTTIQYMVSTGPANTYTWRDYTDAGVTMLQSQGGYVYARIKYSADKYSAVTLFDYTFGGVTTDPRVTPNTGISSGGEVAAATIGSATTISLASRTPNAVIYYLVSETSQAVTLERVSVPPQDVTQDGDIGSDNYKYLKIGSRWYRTAFTELQKYSDDIQLSHDKRDPQLMYLSAVALAEGYEPSTVLEYIYKVQPAQQVENPEAAFETRYMPGGETIEAASVARGANISFFSVTPGAELYYELGSGTEVPTKSIPNDGITVEGDYGSNFVVRVQAKKDGMLDSDIMTFVYTISEQEMTSAPTATPGTTADVPTTVLPGNKILLSSSTKEASIYYTTDGSSPKVIENEEGTFSAADENTMLYDPNSGIVMPLDGSGYFSITAVAVKTGLAKSQEVLFTYTYPGAVLEPYANIDSGKVELNTVILLKNLTEGAVIYYNVAYGEETPADPTLSSSVFSEEYPFTITQKTTIKAMAAKDGVKSKVVTFTYDPMSQLAAPQASIESGSVVARGTVLKLIAADGATIYYTMDGSDPTDSENTAVMSGNTLTLNGEAGGQVTIKAYAKAADRSQSEVATFTYQFSQNTGGVTASIESGSLVSDGTKVNLISDVTGAEIYYTTDGSSPIENGKKGTTVEIKGTPGSSFTIKAVAIVDGEPGIIATFIYRIKEIPDAPTASPSGGTLTVATRVTLNSSEEEIYYTTDGTEPTKSSIPYTEPILINRTTTLKAIAVSEDGEISKVATFVYTAAQKASMVVSTKADGEVLEPGTTVSLSTDTSNAVIYYSTDGTVPTLDNLESMLVYNGESIEINRNVTIHAVAYREDLRLSEVAVWNYTVDMIPAVEQKKAEEAKLAEEGLRDTDASALERNNEQEKDITTRRVREKEYGTLVSYAADLLPAQVKLMTAKETIDPYTAQKAKELFGTDKAVLESYQLKIKEGNLTVQPKEEVEVALPIPKGFEDAALSIAMVTEDYEVTALETRREDGMLYAKTSIIGSYVIIGPERADNAETEFPYLLLLEIAAGAVLLGGVIYYAKEKIKKYLKKK